MHTYLPLQVKTPLARRNPRPSHTRCEGDRRLRANESIRTRCGISAQARGRHFRRPVDDDPTRTVSIGTLLPELEKDQLFMFLKNNADIFAWMPSNMSRIISEVITHKLNINPSFKPIR